MKNTPAHVKALEEGREALKARLAEVHEAYNAKPRRAPMIDRYCRVANKIGYALSCARERLHYGDAAAPALRLLKQGQGQADRLLEALRADPYECKSEEKAQLWADVQACRENNRRITATADIAGNGAKSNG
jgi:hypothetical protein